MGSGYATFFFCSRTVILRLPGSLTTPSGWYRTPMGSGITLRLMRVRARVRVRMRVRARVRVRMRVRARVRVRMRVRIRVILAIFTVF